MISTHGHAGVELTYGPTNFYAGGGYAVLHGQNVERNSETEAGVGGSTRVAKWDDADLRVGVDLVYFGYDRNLRYFTLGQGGYFSPQNFFAALVPITYSATPSDRLKWTLGGTIGFQSYTEASSNLFPTSPQLQSQAANLFKSLAVNSSGTASSTPYYYPFYPGSQKAGIAGSMNGSVEYKVSREFILGGKASWQHFANWDEGGGQLYVRYLFLEGE